MLPLDPDAEHLASEHEARAERPMSSSVVRLIDERNALRAEIQVLRRESIRILQLLTDALEDALGQREAVLAEARAAAVQLAGLRSERGQVEQALRATREQLTELVSELESMRSERVQVLLRVEHLLRDALEQREALLADTEALRREREMLRAETQTEPVDAEEPGEIEASRSPGSALRYFAVTVLALVILALAALATTSLLPLRIP